MEDLRAKSFALRRDVLDMVYRAGTGHIGGDFSVMDILVALYFNILHVNPDNPGDPDRDRFILSKGHSVEAYYAVLADRGFFPKKDLTEYSRFGSKYIGHPNNKINGIEMNSGSLGHGLSVAVGMALAGRMDKKDYRVYTVMGDGELAEGSVWEGFLAGGHYRLDHLCAVIDRNRLQISGKTEEVMAHDELERKLSDFHWNVLSVPGNDIGQLTEAFQAARKTEGCPTAIIANTTKGCGVSFMENQVGWHHRIPKPEEYEAAVQELERKMADGGRSGRGAAADGAERKGAV